MQLYYAEAPLYLFRPPPLDLSRLEKVARLIFHPADDKLLEYLNDEGQSIEPRWYIPAIMGEAKNHHTSQKPPSVFERGLVWRCLSLKQLVGRSLTTHVSKLTILSSIMLFESGNRSPGDWLGSEIHA